MTSNLRRLLAALCTLLLCASLATAAGKKPVRRGTTAKSSHAKSSQAKSSHARSTSASKRSKSKSKKKVAKSRGQRAIDPARARQIQGALVRVKYLEGMPSGVWDQPTKDAMMRYQADHGWQTKVVPDSRALISLGLGPNHANVINPESVRTPILRDGGMMPGGATPQ